jgi:hypothetical protein
MARQDLLYRVRRGLAHLISPEEAATPGTRRKRASREPEKSLDAEADFAARLKKLLAEAGPSAKRTGHVCQIGLAKIRQRFGASWERVAERADRIACNTIERYLAPGDIYGALPSGVYAIVFAQLAEEGAKAKCALIAQEIAKALVGEKGTDVLDLKIGPASADGSYSVREMTVDEDFLSRVAAASPLEAAEQGEEASAPAAAEARDATKPDGGRRDAPRSPATAPPEQLANLRVSYRPIWDRARNVVSTYLCAGRLLAADGGEAGRDGGAVTGGAPAARGQLDELTLMRALDHLGDLLREKRVALIVVPLHFETVGTSARRQRIVQLLADRVADAERKLLVIEVEGVPAGAPQARLMDIVAPLRHRCRAIMLHVPIDTIDFTSFKACGARAVGVDIARHGESELVIMQQMNRFARLAREKAGLQSCLLGANSTSLAAAALGAGFDYIGGDAVARPVDHPDGLVEFSAANLFIGSANA